MYSYDRDVLSLNSSWSTALRAVFHFMITRFFSFLKNDLLEVLECLSNREPWQDHMMGYELNKVSKEQQEASMNAALGMLRKGFMERWRLKDQVV